MEILCFKLDEKEYGIPISGVSRIIRMVAITPVSELSKYHLGVINLHGQIVFVFDIRQCLGLQGRAENLHDCIIVIETDDRRGAIVADMITEIIDTGVSDIDYSTEPIHISRYIDSMLKSDGKVLPIFNPENFLNLTEYENTEFRAVH